MIKTDELRGIIAKNGLSQSDVASKIGVTPKTFYEKMKNGVFGSDEIQIMIDELHIEDPMSIFFAKGQLLRIPNLVRTRKGRKMEKLLNTIRNRLKKSCRYNEKSYRLLVSGLFGWSISLVILIIRLLQFYVFN